jgi:hypothetical protein
MTSTLCFFLKEEIKMEKRAKLEMGIENGK